MGAFVRVSFILVVIIYYFFSHGTFRFLLGLLVRVPGADLSGGGPGSRGIGFSSFYGRFVRSLGVYSKFTFHFSIFKIHLVIQYIYLSLYLFNCVLYCIL